MAEHKLKDVFTLSCPSCGGKLAYSAEKKKIACNYCGHSEEPNQSNDEVLEQVLSSALEKAGTLVVEETGKKVIHCDNCGSNYMIGKEQVATQCSFCASKKVNVEAFNHRIFQPSGIIPLNVSQEEGFALFEKWIKKGIFHPRKLKRMASVENLHGIYIPFWTYDAHTENTYTGDAGFHYYESKRVKVNGQWQEQRVQKTRWVRKSGRFSHFFDDVLVVASQGIQQKHIEKIFPYHLDNVINFDPRIMIGWEAEVYGIEIDEGYQIADKIMDRDLSQYAKERIGGDTQRFVNVQTRKTQQTFKHIILPLWICSYQFKGKSYQFLINGQTGRVGGEKPISYIKIALMVLVFVGLLAGLYFYKEYGG